MMTIQLLFDISYDMLDTSVMEYENLNVVFLCGVSSCLGQWQFFDLQNYLEIPSSIASILHDKQRASRS